LVLVFFATIGVVDFSEATVIGIAALTMAFFFIVTMWSFSRSGRALGRPRAPRLLVGGGKASLFAASGKRAAG
ncbi:MAG: hypothetical protein H0T96_08305, partial [Thermoleophilaceae bacterium]|nr:hypothetical protein [Thermoleophilaceae bacterium]